MRTIQALAICAAVAVGATTVLGQPAYFALTAPANGAALATPSVTVFSWQASSGATKYWLELLLDPTADWSTAERVSSSGTSVSMNPELYGMIAGKSIAWRVQACNAQGQCVHNTGGVRTARIALFPAPLSSPAHNSYTENRRPTLTWKRMSGAQYYKVVVNGQILTTGNGVQGNASAPAGTTYTFTPTQDLSGTFVDWSVQSCAMIGGGMLCGPAFNSAQTFRLNFGAPPPTTFKPDLGPGGPPGQFIPGGQVVAGLVKVQYVVNTPAVYDVPLFARNQGFEFQSAPLTTSAVCGVGFSSSGFAVVGGAPMSADRFHLAAAVKPNLLPSGVGPVSGPRCRFTLFTLDKLQPGWRLKNASFGGHGGPIQPWAWAFEQPPKGIDEDATFSIVAQAGPMVTVTAPGLVNPARGLVLELQKIVLEGPPGKAWRDAFRP